MTKRIPRKPCPEYRLLDPVGVNRTGNRLYCDHYVGHPGICYGDRTYGEYFTLLVKWGRASIKEGPNDEVAGTSKDTTESS